MKTIKNLLFVAFAAMTIAACQKEFADNSAVSPTGNLVSFSAAVGDTDVETKTAIHYQEGVESFSTLFTDADLISVNGVKTETVVPSDDQKTITFSVADVTAPYYAVSGTHDKDGYDPETHTYTLQFSGTASPQQYRTTGNGQYASYWTSADILAAYSTDNTDLKFQHMSTFYAITLNEAESTVKNNIKSIYIRQGDGENVAGLWTLSFEGEENTPMLTPSNLTALVAYDCGEDGLALGTTMIVGIPAYDYPEGLIFTIKDVNGNFASYKVPASKTKHAADGGKIIPFKPAYSPVSGTIKTVADWEEFASCVNSASKDWDLYRWVGDGTVKLGADLEAETLTTITKDFPYVFDGCGYTITRTAATRSLFLEVSGEIKNLTLAGNLTLSDAGAPFVKQLNPGAKITSCINNMDVTFEFNDETTYVAGFAAVLPTTKEEQENATTLTNCTNNGDFTGATRYSLEAEDAPFNVAIGGILGDVRAGGSGAVAYDVVLTNCDNTGSIKFTPQPSDPSTAEGADLKPSMGFTGIGGVAGTLRASKSVKFDDCDNSGTITLSAEGMTNKNGVRPYSISMGGIIGYATGTSGMGVSLVGHDITLKNCDNSGVLYNCGDNYSPTKRGNNKVFTGGIAGALVGQEGKYASLQSCSNTGTILTYDLCSDDNPVPAVVSIRPCYNAVAGGLVGFGGYLDMDGCTVNCQIGNGRRPMVAWGGVIGYTVRPFKLQGTTTLHLRGYFQRISTYKWNRAVVAVVPASTADDKLTPDVSGSVISGTIVVSSEVYSSGSTAGTSTYTNLSSNLTTHMFKDAATAKKNLVCGQSFVSKVDGKEVHTANAGVDITGVTVNN